MIAQYMCGQLSTIHLPRIQLGEEFVLHCGASEVRERPSTQNHTASGSAAVKVLDEKAQTKTTLSNVKG